jgi:hypothetical protein
MRMIECQQGSAEWFEARKGIPSASNFHRIITPTGKPAAAAEEYACELVAERLCMVQAAEKPTSAAMKHGLEYEAEARRWVEFELGTEIGQVGFITTDDGRAGCSPDGLMFGPDGKPIGGLELKAPQGRAHIRWLLDGKLPAEHRAQVIGSLLVTGLPSWTFASYCPGLPPLLVKVVEDEFTDKLRKALDEFWNRYSEILERFTRKAA